ncbi:MAG: hypothetical protein IKJ24_02670 [Clostridia bacterium]|nr:hypothetical protein [Clostridia bacterium]
MNAEAFAKKTGFKTVCIPSPDKEVEGVYIGDLLSWVMGKAEQGNVWITIMSNINTVAVATLADTSCILLAEGVMPDENALEAAKTKGVNILSTPLSAYEAAMKISELLR